MSDEHGTGCRLVVARPVEGLKSISDPILVLVGEVAIVAAVVGVENSARGGEEVPDNEENDATSDLD